MKILVLGDLHIPWVEIECLKAAHAFNRKYKADLVIQMGDLIDAKAWSRYPKDPDDLSPHHEWEATEIGIDKLHKLFPELTILSGNHDRRPMMRAFEAGIPKKLVRALDTYFDHPGWKWHMGPNPFEADKIAFVHGDEMAGNAWQKAKNLGQSLVQGHDHMAYLHYINTFNRQTFAMSVGCMMDAVSIAARYAAKNPSKMWLGWATITDGEPHLHRWIR